jgi:hypothetical protein
LIVPTLRVVTPRLTLCVNVDAKYPARHFHAGVGTIRKSRYAINPCSSPACRRQRSPERHRRQAGLLQGGTSFAAGSRQIVGKPASHAFGSIKSGAVILSPHAAFDFALLANIFHLPRRTCGAKTSPV